MGRSCRILVGNPVSQGGSLDPVHEDIRRCTGQLSVARSHSQAGGRRLGTGLAAPKPGGTDAAGEE